MNQKLLKRFEDLKGKNPKLEIIYELYKLRNDFSEEPPINRKIEKDKILKKNDTRKTIGSAVSEQLDKKAYHSAVLEFIDILLYSEIKLNGIDKLQEKVKNEPDFTFKVGISILNGKKDYLKQTNKFIENELATIIFSAPLMPIFKNISSMLEKEKMKARGKKCTICGEPFNLSVYNDKRRYLLCKLCNARFSAELFWCPNCKNRDFKKLGFLVLEGEKGIQIDTCRVCNTYIKAGNEQEIGPIDDPILFDLATVDLDAAAKDKKLVPLDKSK